MDIFILDTGANLLRFRTAIDQKGNYIYILYTGDDTTR